MIKKLYWKNINYEIIILISQSFNPILKNCIHQFKEKKNNWDGIKIINEINKKKIIRCSTKKKLLIIIIIIIIINNREILTEENNFNSINASRLIK